MHHKTKHPFLFSFGLALATILLFAFSVKGQQVYTKALLKADSYFIKKEYAPAAELYAKYVEKHPKDYYASRQAALCYEFINDPYNACEFWPAVAESAESNEDDWFRYGMSLLQNNRDKEAAKVFPMLARSKNKLYAMWGKSYAGRAQFYSDSSKYVLNAVIPLNTTNSELAPVLLDNRLFYASESSKNARAYNPSGAEAGRMLTIKTVLDTFRFAETELYKELEKIAVFGQVCFSPDGQDMFFCKAVSNTEAGIKSPYSFQKYQLFMVPLNSGSDISKQIKPFPFNSMLYNYMHPFISTDGELLFFCSDMKGSFGGTDIYMSRKINGEWTAPYNLGPKINTIGNEVYPRYLKDGSLCFSSDAWPGIGGLDIFISKQDDGIFQTPMNLGYPINSRYDDAGLYYTAANKGYFSSNRNSESGYDLYYFSHSD